MNYCQKTIIALTIMVMAAAGMTACSCDDHADASSPESGQPQTFEAKTGDLTTMLSIPGNISMPHRANFSFGINGIVEELNVGFGDEVKEADVLARLDDDSLQRAVSRARSDLRTAEINLKQFHQDTSILEAEAAVKSAEASLTMAEIALKQATEFSISDAEIGVENARRELEATRKSGELLIAEKKSQLESAWNGWDEYLQTNEENLPGDELELLIDEERLWEDIIEAENKLENALRNPGYSIDKAQAEIRSAYDILSGISPDIPQMQFAAVQARASLSEAANDLVYIREGYGFVGDVLIAEHEDIDPVAGAKGHLENARAAWVDLVSGHIDILTTSYNPSVQGKELLLAIKTAAMNLQIAQENADASVDTAEINLSIAKRTLESASAQILQKEADTASARANLARARDELAHVQDGLNLELPRMAFDKARLAFEEAQDQLADAALTAPFDGIVAAVNIDAGDQIMASTVVMQMVDTGKVEIAAAVDEIDVAKMKIGQQAEIYVDAFRDIALPGEVTAISPMGRNQSGLITYDLTISIKDSKGYPLKDLMTVTVDIEAVLASDVLLVPNAAIHKDRATGSKTVTVLADSGEEEVRVVWTGVSDGKLTEITSGLKEGERIVSSVDIEVTESSIEAPGADVDIMECITNMQELMPCFEKLMGMADELGIDTSTYSGGEIDWDEIEYWANNDTGEVPDDVQECLQKLLENRDCLDALIRMAEDMGIDTSNFSLDNMGGMMGN